MPSFLERIKARKFSSAASNAVDIGVNGDTQARLAIDAGGKLLWGSGSATGDVTLYRDSADVLKTDDTFKVPTLFIDSIEVDTTGAVTNDVLKYDGTKFTAASVSAGGGGGATNLDGLTDVVITAPEEFQGLSYNGTSWVNSHIPLVSYVRNAESTTITTGTCVYLFGSTGDHATVKRADNNSDTTSSKTIGVAGADITASNNGPIITRGYVDGIDLSVGYTAGDILWLGENGAFTKTKPTSPDHLVFIGVVVRATNNGIIYVATQNGYELNELHDVSITNKASGDFLKYDGTLWVNDAINLGTDTVGNYMSGVSAGTGISVTHTPGEGSTATIAVTANTYQPYTSVSDALPASPVTGQFWYESDTGKTFIYYDSQWIEIVGSVGPTGATGLISNPYYDSGEYYQVARTNTASNWTMNANQTYFARFYNAGSQTFDRIGVRTSTSFSGTAVVRLGVYNNNTNGNPSTVLFDAGTVSCTVANTFYQITINQTIPEGWYWLAVNTQTAATTNQFFGGAFTIWSPILQRTGQDLALNAGVMTETSVSGSFATVNTANLSWMTFNVAAVTLRAA